MTRASQSLQSFLFRRSLVTAGLSLGLCLVFLSVKAMISPVSADLYRGMPNYRYGSDTVSYYSAAGRKLIKKWDIPTPPIVNLPMKRLDPPRNIAANQWKAPPFCQAWTDGCGQCSRSQATEASSCKATSQGAEQTCRPHEVWCTTSFGNDALERSCGFSQDFLFLEYEDGSILPHGESGAAVTWFYSLREPKPKWQYFVAEDSYLPPYRKEDKPRKPQASYDNIVCHTNILSARGSELGDGVLIQRR